MCTVWKQLTGILTRYVTTKGKGKGGTEERGGEQMNRERQRGREREYRGIYWLKAGLHAPQCVRNRTWTQARWSAGTDEDCPSVCVCSYICACVCARACVKVCVHMCSHVRLSVCKRGESGRVCKQHAASDHSYVGIPKQWIWVLLHKSSVRDWMSVGIDDGTKHVWGLNAHVCGCVCETEEFVQVL